MAAVVGVFEMADFMSGDVVDAGRRGVDDLGIQTEGAVREGAARALGHSKEAEFGFRQLPLATPVRPAGEALLKLLSSEPPEPAVECIFTAESHGSVTCTWI